MVNVLLRHPALVAGVPLVSLLLGAVAALVRGPRYVAEASFLPQSTSVNVSRLSGLAAQLGFNVGALSENATSPAAYLELLQSRDLLEQAALTRYHFPIAAGSTDSLSGTLIELYHIRGETEAERIWSAIARLRRDLSARVEFDAGMVRFTVAGPWPDLTVRITRRLLQLVNEFDLHKRQRQAAAERVFVEARLAESRRELEAAEDALQAFLEKNRLYQDSPELVFQYERLQRRVGLAQQVYTSLAQAYEQARIEEVRNTPVITVLDGPERSVRRSRGLLRMGAVGAMLGGMLGVSVALSLEFLALQRRAHPAEFAESMRLLRRWVPQRLTRLLPSP